MLYIQSIHTLQSVSRCLLLFTLSKVAFENSFSGQTTIHDIELSHIRVTLAFLSTLGMNKIQKKATVRTTWNIKKKTLCNLNLSAKPPNNGFEIKPEIGKIVYIVPTNVAEKPNCFAIVGKNGTIGPVAAKK